MRILGVLGILILLAPWAVAEPATTIRQCAEPGCVIVKDSDEDGHYDWANAAFAVTQLLVLNANTNRSVLLFEVIVTTDEIGGSLGETIAHEIGEATGEEPGVHTLALVGSANATAPDGSPGFHDADILVAVLHGDHETGEQQTLAWQYARIFDDDGDGLPTAVETLP